MTRHTLPIQLHTLRELALVKGSEPDRPRYLSAASGLVVAGRHVYVVADDELHLGVFHRDDTSPGTLLRLFDGELPDNPGKRKKHKPDLEALVRLPAFAHHPHGALLALGSGSTQRRDRGAWLSLQADGSVHGKPQVLDTAAWLQALSARLGELNIEGAWVSGDEFHLLQRGNKGTGVNAVASYDLDALLKGLRDATMPALIPQHIREFDLGQIDGVPLCFSDACPVRDDRWLFTAVAEDTDTAVADGAFAGAAIGMVAEHQLRWVRTITPAFKIEGIDVLSQAAEAQVLLVTDADDLSVPAVLLSASLRLD